MGKIELTPAELLEQSHEMIQIKNQYELIFKNVSNVLKEVNENWSDNLANNFGGKISAAQKSFEKIEVMLQVGSDIAQQSANAFQNADSNLAKISDMLEDVCRNIIMKNPTAHTGDNHLILTKTDIAEILANVEKGMEKFIEESKGGSTLIFDFIDDWAETKEGETFEAGYDLIDELLDEYSPLGKLKDAYDIAKDILKEGIDFETGTDVFSLFDNFGLGKTYKPYMTAFWETMSVVTNPETSYIKRSYELQDMATEAMLDGEIITGLKYLGASFVEGVGKGVVDVGCKMIDGVLKVGNVKLSTVGEVVKVTTGLDFPGVMNDMGSAIGDGVSGLLNVFCGIKEESVITGAGGGGGYSW